MNKQVTALVLGGLLAAPLGGMSVSLAGEKKSSTTVETKLQAKLRQPVGAVPIDDFGGKVQYKKKSSVKKGIEEELSAKVESPIPNLSAGIDDVNAASVMFLLKILGAPLAPSTTPTEKGSCILLIKAIEFEYTGGTTLAEMEAEYAAKVKERTPLAPALPSVSSKIGSCQTAPLVLGGVGAPGVPDIVLGDLAEIHPIAAPGTPTTPLLSGIFQKGGNDDDDD